MAVENVIVSRELLVGAVRRPTDRTELSPRNPVIRARMAENNKKRRKESHPIQQGIVTSRKGAHEDLSRYKGIDNSLEEDSLLHLPVELFLTQLKSGKASLF